MSTEKRVRPFPSVEHRRQRSLGESIAEGSISPSVQLVHELRDLVNALPILGYHQHDIALIALGIAQEQDASDDYLRGVRDGQQSMPILFEIARMARRIFMHHDRYGKGSVIAGRPDVLVVGDATQWFDVAIRVDGSYADRKTANAVAKGWEADLKSLTSSLRDASLMHDASGT